MATDQVFRAALLLIVVAIFPIGVYHRLRARATREPLDRRQEGIFILATLRPIGMLFNLAMVAYLVNPTSLAWSSMPLPLTLRWSGVVLCVLAGGLLIWTFRRLGKNLTDTVVTRREHTLVVNGPYRWVRHPFYDSIAMLVLGTSLAAANWFLLGTGALVICLLVWRTRAEEAKLLARFGDSYRNYLNSTGRFIPKIRAVGRE